MQSTLTVLTDGTQHICRTLCLLMRPIRTIIWYVSCTVIH